LPAGQIGDRFGTPPVVARNSGPIPMCPTGSCGDTPDGNPSPAVRTCIMESFLILGPSTIRDIAHRLARSPESLYHHIGILERAGLIRVHDIRPTAKTRQTVYAPVCTRLRLDRSKRSPAMRRARAAAIRGLDEGPESAKRLRVETVILPLDPATLPQLHAHVDALFTFLRTHRGTNLDTPPTALTIALTPTSTTPKRPRPRRKPR